ncbi:MAG TPA: ABC transporter permease [Terriglobales bacterium]|nr:ABC transporter permease [Terriglobales bacterium]
METLAANLRYALRLVRKAPMFSAAVILTLALGIGANTAVFSAVDAVLLRPLPYPQAGELVRVQQREKDSKNLPPFIAPVRLEDWNRMNSTFQAITGWYTEDVSETSGPLPEKMTRAWVAPRFLQVWGVSPLAGRDFTPEEEKFGGPNAVLISDHLWRQRFHADPAVIGKQLHFGVQSSQSFATIVGVMPASFFPDRSVDFWEPVPADAPYAQSRQNTWYTSVGRLKDGVTLEQARADLALVQGRLGAQFPKTDGSLLVDIQSLKETTVAGSRRSLWMLFASVTLLLLIACTNVAALLLARATDREQETSIRFSLGASRGAVAVQLLTEALVLAAAGALLALAVASAAIGVFRSMARDLPRAGEIVIDWRIALYAFLCAAIATLICGALPAWRATRGGLAGALARSGRTQVSGRNPLQWTLVGIQIALAVVLLVGAGLLLRSFQELARVSPGFDVHHVLTLRVSASWGESVDMNAVKQRISRLTDTLRAVPGVEAAATASALPGIPQQFPTELKLLDGEADPHRKIFTDSRFVSAGYFAVMRIPLLAGDTCHDRTDDTRDLIVNRSFVDRYFGGAPALGHHLQVASNAIGFNISGQIAGIAADAREQGINTAPMPTVYWCMSNPTPSPYFLVRTAGDPRALAETLRRAIHQAEPSRSVYNIAPLEEMLSDAFAENRLRTLLLALFALTAAALACVGLYGTLSYVVSVRRREVGLRLALGAHRPQIVLRFLSQALRVCGIGCACGLAIAAASRQVLAGMLFGISAFDPGTFAGVALLLLAVAACAALLPALRAARTDPMNVLREG